MSLSDPFVLTLSASVVRTFSPQRTQKKRTNLQVAVLTLHHSHNQAV